MNDKQDDQSPRHRRAALELPDTTDLSRVGEAEMLVIRAASQGLISSRVALDFTLMLDHRRRSIGDVQLEQMMDRIEKRQQQLDARRNGGT